MSVVSKYGDERILYPQRRVYTAPIQDNYMARVEYLNPQNLNETIPEEYVNFSLPAVLPGQNVYDPTRRPSENLTIHMNYVPLQYTTENDRMGSSRFHDCVNDPMPKLRTKSQILQRKYAKTMTKEDISFYRKYPASADFGDISNLARLVRGDHPDTTAVNQNAIPEPVGDTYRETFNYTKSHRVFNVPNDPQTQAQEQLQLFYKTGRWV